MLQRFGASPEAWDHFADKLGLADDLLPVVSNPHGEISEKSKMQAIGKTPSVYNRDRKVVGLPEWTKLVANPHLIERWKAEADYGISLQTRRVRAFDIDVPDRARAAAIQQAINDCVGMALPCRFRDNSGKRLLAFTYSRALTKRVVPVEGGMIEVLAEGQQFIAAGAHIDSKAGFEGAFYKWTSGDVPACFPVLTKEQLEAVWALLVTMYSTGEPRIARERRAGSGADLQVHDDVADWLVENWEVYDVGGEGQVFIECPFADEHTSDTGASSTAYFPAGTGGYAQGHFVCLHAHCVGRADVDYLDATGYRLAQFADLGEAPARSETLARTDLAPLDRNAKRAENAAEDDLGPGTQHTAFGVVERARIPRASTPEGAGQWPAMVRDAKGKIEPTAENLVNAISHGGMAFKRISYDAFTDNLVWAPSEQEPATAAWRRFTDADLVNVRIELERRGFKAMGKEMLREATHAGGHHNTLDAAKEWLGRLSWDGVPRVAAFAADCWGWGPSAYSTAVSCYVWTAMAGRVIQPGVRADMAPILAGAQGIKKTTAIQSMVPHEDMYAEIKLDDRDDDISRKLRGKLVAELEELRGLNSRELEDIKAFISRRRESWIPKYKEFEAFFWRRNVFIGSTNDWAFLADPTGERRWLPGQCERGLDIDRIIDTRDQLWAEGAQLFVLEGVMWEDAERLAKIEHPQFKVADAWERTIVRWLDTEGIDKVKPMDKGYVLAGEIMAGALGLGPAQQNRQHEARVERAMQHLGFKKHTVEEDGYKFKGFSK